jgi:hypothetical protein
MSTANFTDLVLLNCLSSAARTTVAVLGGGALPVRDASPPNARLGARGDDRGHDT